jgi:LPXTG-motif cell wall-anchored protein
MRTIKILAVAVATLALLWLAGPAMAQQDPYPPGGGVEGENQGQDGQDGNVSGSTEAEGDLPFTGAEITLYSAVGLGAIGAGVLILRRTRTKTDA